MDDGSILQIILMFICIAFSAYFSATETAFTSLNRVTVKTLAAEGNKKAERVLRLSENYDKLLTTILVGNNIVNITLSSVATLFFINNISKNFGATISTIVVTVLVLIFGEITPKNIAKENSESFAMAVSGSISFFVVIFTPLNWFFSLFQKLASKLFKSKSVDSATENEILTLVDEAESQGEFDSDESELIRSAIEFNDVEAIDIFTPRVDLVAVSHDATNAEIAKIFSESGFSRLPVYKDTIDNIIGTINEKDFYKKCYKHTTPITKIIHKPFFIPDCMKISDLLKELQKQKRHIAIVTDEFGGTKGIVTMEDILEELVGEIWDEHDTIVNNITRINDNEYDVLCSMEFDEFCEFFQFISDADVNSVGGFVLEQLGKVPEVDDEFVFENLEVKVTETDEKRASVIHVLVNDPEETDEEDEDEEE